MIPALAWAVTDNNSLVVNQNTDRVGMGTDAPDSKLQVIGDARIGSETNYAGFETDGTLTFNGSATVFDDLRVPISSAKLLGNSDPDWETFVGGTYALAFADNVDQEVFFSCQIPHGWKLGSNLNPHIHWSPDGTDTGSVTWKLEYAISDISGTFTSSTTMSATDAGDGVDRKHQYVDLGDIDMSAYTETNDVSIMLINRLWRDVDDGDDFSGDAFLLEIDFHYEIDTIGSRSEASK